MKKISIVLFLIILCMSTNVKANTNKKDILSFKINAYNSNTITEFQIYKNKKIKACIVADLSYVDSFIITIYQEIKINKFSILKAHTIAFTFRKNLTW
jgi:hypothetical protein